MAPTKHIASCTATAAILILSFIKTGEGAEYPLFPHADKAVHAAMYFALAAAFCYDSRKSAYRGRPLASMLGCIVAALAIGAVTELGQEYLTDYRSGDIYDLLADAAGGVAGAATATYILVSKNKKRKKDSGHYA